MIGMECSPWAESLKAGETTTATTSLGKSDNDRLHRSDREFGGKVEKGPAAEQPDGSEGRNMAR